jgi:hypothetical protein
LFSSCLHSNTFSVFQTPTIPLPIPLQSPTAPTMRLVHILLSVGLAASRVIPRREQSGCSNPVKRVDFLTLNDAARKQYTNAVECLATKPSMIGLNATLYDDFAYVHAQLGSTGMYQFQNPACILTDVFSSSHGGPISCPGTDTLYTYTRRNSTPAATPAPWCKSRTNHTA